MRVVKGVVDLKKTDDMGKNLALCMLAFVLWGCSSDGNTIVDEPENGETPVVDSDISLDTPPREYAGYVYKYQDLDYEYLVTLGFKTHVYNGKSKIDAG